LLDQARQLNIAQQVSKELAGFSFGPYYATPCGVLSPLLAELEMRSDYTTIAREDNAVGEAVGAALGGRNPVVLMQNSGFGNSVNALASLVVPYRIPILFIVSMRGITPDHTPENFGMGKITKPIFEGLGVNHETLEPHRLQDQIGEAFSVVHGKGEPTALLVNPDLFGWSA
jgi:sulfopyruvate decarboxylase subunit alpha